MASLVVLMDLKIAILMAIPTGLIYLHAKNTKMLKKPSIVLTVIGISVPNVLSMAHISAMKFRPSRKQGTESEKFMELSYLKYKGMITS